jgi:hypothetical protein
VFHPQMFEVQTSNALLGCHSATTYAVMGCDANAAYSAAIVRRNRDLCDEEMTTGFKYRVS